MIEEHFPSEKVCVLIAYNKENNISGIYKDGRIQLTTKCNPLEIFSLLRKTCEGDIVQLAWFSCLEKNIEFPKTTYELFYGNLWEFKSFHETTVSANKGMVGKRFCK